MVCQAMMDDPDERRGSDCTVLPRVKAQCGDTVLEASIAYAGGLGSGTCRHSTHYIVHRPMKRRWFSVMRLVRF